MNYGRNDTHTVSCDNREQLAKQSLRTFLDKVRDDLMCERGNMQA